MRTIERALEDGREWAASASPQDLKRLAKFRITDLSNDEVDQEAVSYGLTGDPVSGIFGDDDGRDRSSVTYLRAFVRGATEAVATC